jgi:hypothetical protein
MPKSVSTESVQIGIRNLSNFDENSVISFWIEIFRRLNGLSTPFYTPNVAHANFSVETITANPKTQAFKFRRCLCSIVPDGDILEFKRSFHSFLQAERSACRFQSRNNPVNPKTQSFNFRRKLCYFVPD